MASVKKVVAWQVWEDFDGRGCIVFHHHRLAARRIGAAELNSEDTYVLISRAKEFDQYAECGKVPPLALLDKGWRISCSMCGEDVQITESTPRESIAICGDLVTCNRCKKNRPTDPDSGPVMGDNTHKEMFGE